jgi:hypothetical protein
MPLTKPMTAVRIHATPRALVIDLPDRSVSLSWKDCSEKLATASTAHRLKAYLGPGGYGIHWPLLDEDLSVGGLIARKAIK